MGMKYQSEDEVNPIMAMLDLTVRKILSGHSLQGDIRESATL